MSAQHGLLQLHDCNEPVADIIFVHGLFGHAQKTWTAKRRRKGLGGTEKSTSDASAKHSAKSGRVDKLFSRARGVFHRERRERQSDTSHKTSISRRRNIPRLEDRQDESATYTNAAAPAAEIAEDDVGDYTSESASDAESSQQSKDPVFWPKELLPQVLSNVRVFSFGYDVDISHFFGSAAQSNVLRHSQDLLSDVADVRPPEGQPDLPIIFVVHSLGGIVVKGALGASSTAKTYLNQVLPRVRGVIFLGTPHRGADIAALATTVHRATKVLWKRPNLAILESLKIDSEILERVHSDFVGILHDHPQIQLRSFHEQYLTRGVMVVSPFSSVMGLATEVAGSIPANHSNMTKFCQLSDPGFCRIIATLDRWIKTISNAATETTSILPLLGSEAEFTVSYPPEQELRSLPAEPAWLRVLHQYKGSFPNHDTTVKNESHRVLSGKHTNSERLVSVLDAWRVLSAEVSHRSSGTSSREDGYIYVNGMRFGAKTSSSSGPSQLIMTYLGPDVDNYHATALVASALLAQQLFHRRDVTPTKSHCGEQYISSDGDFKHVNYPLAFAMTHINEEHQLYSSTHREWRFRFFMVFSPVLIQLWAKDQKKVMADGSMMANRVRSFCENCQRPLSATLDAGSFDPYGYWPLCKQAQTHVQDDPRPFEIKDVVHLLRIADEWTQTESRTAQKEASRFAQGYFGDRAKWVVLICMLNVCWNFKRSSYLPKTFEELMEHEYCLVS